MMPDGNSAAELKQDEDSIDITPYLEDALSSVVEDLMQGEKVGRLTLQGILEDEADLAEMVAASVISRDRTVLEYEIERLLRHELAEHDAVHDRAVEIATGGERE